jgi:hypothetical protein
MGMGVWNSNVLTEILLITKSCFLSIDAVAVFILTFSSMLDIKTVF